jgi:hypothetical protein
MPAGGHATYPISWLARSIRVGVTSVAAGVVPVRAPAG